MKSLVLIVVVVLLIGSPIFGITEFEELNSRDEREAYVSGLFLGMSTVTIIVNELLIAGEIDPEDFERVASQVWMVLKYYPRTEEFLDEMEILMFVSELNFTPALNLYVLDQLFE